MNLILDVDGTLVDKVDEDPVERPFLKEFLSFVFSHFITISIWTNATPLWLQKVLNTVLAPALPEGKNFYFIWTREQCVTERVHLHPRPYTRKPLSQVYAAFPLTHSPENTLIIDDSPETYAHNPLNAVPIKTYHWGAATCGSDDGSPRGDGEEENEEEDEEEDGDQLDKELLRLIAFFKLTYFS